MHQNRWKIGKFAKTVQLANKGAVRKQRFKNG